MPDFNRQNIANVFAADCELTGGVLRERTAVGACSSLLDGVTSELDGLCRAEAAMNLHEQRRHDTRSMGVFCLCDDDIPNVSKLGHGGKSMNERKRMMLCVSSVGSSQRLQRSKVSGNEGENVKDMRSRTTVKQMLHY